MKKTIALGLAVLVSFAGAESNRSVPNLKGIMTPCFPAYAIAVSDSLNPVSPTTKITVKELVETRLQAYRLLKTECPIGSPFLSVSIEAFKLKNESYAYITTVDVYDTVKFPGWVSIWSSGSYGTTGQTGETMARDFATTVATTIDQFAADYAKANP